MRAAFGDGGHGRRGFAFVARVCFLTHSFRADAETSIENVIVQQNNVEFTLTRRRIRKRAREIGVLLKD